MIAQANVTHIVIGKATDLAETTDTRDTLTVGQIGVFLVGSATAKDPSTVLTAGQRFTIAYKKSDGIVIDSPVINFSDISEKNSEDTPAAATARVRALGFNGTSGSIDVANSEDYVVHYKWYDNGKTFGNGKPVKFLAYRSSSSATQVEIAEGIVQNAVVNNSKEKYPIVKAKLLINNAGAVITGTGNITAVNGSKYVTAATDGDAVVSAGDYIRLGTVAGAAVTDDAYRVVSAADGAGGVIELDRAFQGTSTTYTEANCDYIAAATAATADAGVVLTGQEMPFDPGIKYNSPVEFNFWKVGEGFGSTDVSTTAVPSKGVGTYREVAEIEWFLKGNRGETWRVGNYPKDTTLESDSTKTYQQIVIEHVDKNARTLDRLVESPQAVLIASENTAVQHDELKVVLGIS